MSQSGLVSMHVGLVGPVPPPNGGMAMQTAQLARLLAQEGLTVTLLPQNPPHRLALLARIPILRAVVRLLAYLPRVWRLAGRVDVIHLMANSGWSWTLFAAPVVWIGHWRGTPVVVNYRGGNAQQFLERSVSRVRPTLARASALVVPSGFLEAVFAQFGMAASVIPNIVDLQRFRPADTDRPPAHPVRIIVTRNLEPIYGLTTAIQALALLRKGGHPAELYIAGTGPQLNELQALAAELGVAEAVHFAGRLGPGAIENFYRSADLMLNPSTVDNMPNSVLEALASGVPVVSTRVGGVPYVVTNEQTALLVPASDPQAMAAALARLIDDAGLRERLRSAGLAAVQSYAWERVRERWLQTYDRVCGRTEKPVTRGTSEQR